MIRCLALTLTLMTAPILAQDLEPDFLTEPTTSTLNVTLRQGTATNAIDPFLGTFENDEITFIVEPVGRTRRLYGGSIVRDGNSFDFRAEQSNDALVGAFNVTGQSIFFSAAPQRNGQVMEFETGGEHFLLNRVGKAVPVMIATEEDDSPTTSSTLESVPSTENLNRPEAGFFVPIPAPFRLLTTKGRTFILGSDTVPGVVSVVSIEGLSPDRLEVLATQGYADDLIELVPVEEAERKELEFGRAVISQVKGRLPEGDVRGMFGAFLGDEGQELLVIAVASPELWDRLEPHARLFLKEFRLIPIDNSAITGQWNYLLNGKELTRFLNSSETVDGNVVDYQEKVVLRLCPDGKYLEQRHPAEDRADAEPIEVHGSWAIEAIKGDPYLVLTNADGSREQYLLTLRDGRTYVGQERWFRTDILDGANCGEASPTK